MKTILFAFFLFCTSLAKAEETLTIGTTSGYAPFVSLDNEGTYEGFDIDVAKLIAEKLGRKLVIQDGGSMPSLMLSLKQKKVDLLIWAISITEERQKSFDLIYYQGEQVQTMPFLFWKKLPPISSIQELDQTICVEAGTYQDDVLKNYPNLKVKYVDKISDGVMELKYGKVFATAIDHSLVKKYKDQFPEIQVLNLPLAPSEQTLGNGICLNKASSLSSEVRKAVDELRAEGKIAALEKKWKLN
jgi:polar amino acid transport system substrate-binding protein